MRVIYNDRIYNDLNNTCIVIEHTKYEMNDEGDNFEVLENMLVVQL